jgi:catechol 2,3-dioxygenase-like lactoylglutathione lyase family enzyme
MLTGIDHIVIVVSDLDRAVTAFTRAGFTVTLGGRHNVGTHNALIGLADSSYIELIAFLDPVPGHPWFKALERGGGLVDFCMRTDDLETDVMKLRAAGAAISDPATMTRDRPDGYRLKWDLAIPHPPDTGQLPFLIRDETPRDERVPRKRSHLNGVTGLKRVTVAANDPFRAGKLLGSVSGAALSRQARTDLNAQGFSLEIGPHEIHWLTPNTPRTPLAEWLERRGPSPYSATLYAPTSPRTPDDLLVMRAARLDFE